MSDTTYIKKSATFYRIYIKLFLFSLFVVIIIKPFFKEDNAIIDLFIALPIFIIFFMAPTGLYYSWQSFRKKEALPIIRLKYFIGHLFFCILILIFITMFIYDIKLLFGIANHHPKNHHQKPRLIKDMGMPNPVIRLESSGFNLYS